MERESCTFMKVEPWILPPETGAAYHGGVGTRGKRISRGYTLDTRPVPSASKRVFDRGGRHRRNWRQNPYDVCFFTGVYSNPEKPLSGAILVARILALGI